MLTVAKITVSTTRGYAEHLDGKARPVSWVITTSGAASGLRRGSVGGGVGEGDTGARIDRAL
jgi:hypothetical protein